MNSNFKRTFLKKDRRILRAVALGLAILMMAALSPAYAQEGYTFDDALGRTVTVSHMPEKVVSLIGSFAEAYTLAGGMLVGSTEDAITERGLPLGDDVQVIGTLHSPSMELVLSLDPDFVILSAEIPSHREAGQVLENAGIPHAYFTVMSVSDYMHMMDIFCAITGRPDLLARQRETVEAPIAEMIGRAKAQPEYGKRTALLLRAYSTGVKSKGSGNNLAGAILADMGLINLADGGGLLEDITLEAVVAADPDYIFVVTMGSDEEKAMQALAGQLTANPAWGGLTAVAQERFVILPKALFNNKPNSRWPESYAMIEALLYAQ